MSGPYFDDRGSIVGATQPVFPGEIEGETLSDYDRGFAAATAAAGEVLRRLIESREPVKIGRLLLALGDKFSGATSAATARALGLSRQAWQKSHAGLEKLVPVSGVRTGEQRLARSELAKEAHRRRREEKGNPLHADTAGNQGTGSTSKDTALSTTGGNK